MVQGNLLKPLANFIEVVLNGQHETWLNTDAGVQGSINS